MSYNMNARGKAVRFSLVRNFEGCQLSDRGCTIWRAQSCTSSTLTHTAVIIFVLFVTLTEEVLLFRAHLLVC